MKNAMNLIKNLNINNQDYVILACSYGPDSMVLLDLLKKNNLNIIVAHVNHKLRKESDKEEFLLKKYCESNNLIFELNTIKKYPAGNLEMNARVIRYKFFANLIKKYNAKYLFTAHHGDDLMETILMRLTRGSTFKGYAGFNVISQKDNYTLVRPLIFNTKEDIINYATLNNISYALDYTNEEDNYLRNRFRHYILPELKKENPKVHLKFLEFNQNINKYEEYFNKETILIYNKIYLDNILNLTEFNLLDEIFKKRILQKILSEIYDKDIIDINNNHIELIIKLINSKKKNSYVILPQKLKVYKNYNKLKFIFKDEKLISYNYIFNDNLKLSSGYLYYNIKNIEEKSNFVIRLNSKEIKQPLYIRNRKNGDKIKVKNLNGSKKISSIFIDNKLSMQDRSSQPILEDSNGEILWIPGIKKSIFDKQKDETYDIILKYEKKESINEE
ncbi:MAG: tRNA lysidine(34) synthetase TilS [Bacilli bacterium]|nr:tRNA lysidine(34) synthetase TilS [Bacilli bacterium]MDD4406515.1 tRNA lysidine(34) synthetase TilS [Bacilli bacterium]